MTPGITTVSVTGVADVVATPMVMDTPTTGAALAVGMSKPTWCTASISIG